MKKQAEQRSQRAQDETSVKSAENAVALARLEMIKNPLLPAHRGREEHARRSKPPKPGSPS